MNQKSVLVVDDDLIIRKLLRRRLAQERFTVLEAENAFRASQVMSFEPVDLLVTDQKMPGMSGIELIRQIRQVRQIPAILMTGILEGLDLEEDRFTKILRKPFDMSEFLGWVNHYCRSSRNQGEGELKS